VGARVIARTYVDALGAMRTWISLRTATLVGDGNPLQLGAHLKKISGGQPVVYAFLEEQFSLRSEDSAESPDMLAALSAQVYGGTREAATAGAIALAEELSSELDGRPALVPGALIMAVDDIQGPAWQPDGDLPRLLLNWTVRIRPA
jgi:hypothetical protein